VIPPFDTPDMHAVSSVAVSACGVLFAEWLAAGR